MEYWLTLLGVLLLTSYRIAASTKEIDVFLSDSVQVPISTFLLNLSDNFEIIVRSTDVEYSTFCSKIPRSFVEVEGQTALFIVSSTFGNPLCEKNVKGNVVLAKLTGQTITYGSAFVQESGLIEGQFTDLVDYLNSITFVREIVHNVGDTYVGIKERVSLLNPIVVPYWVAIPVIVLLIILICASFFFYIKRPKHIEPSYMELGKGRKLHKLREDVENNTDVTGKHRTKKSSASEERSKSRGSRREGNSRSQVESDREKAKFSSKETSAKRKRAEKEDESSSKKAPAKKKNASQLPSELKKRGRLEVIAKPVTSAEFEMHLHRLAQFTVDYYNNPTVYNVTPDVQPGFLYNGMPKNGPEDPDDFDTIFEDIKSKIMPGLTHWQHPNFFGYYPIGRCFPDMLADFLVSALTVIGFSWDSCPALTEIEQAMINWVGRAFGLPETFLFQDSPESSQGGGTVTESASDAIFCALLAARQWKINQVVEEQRRSGVVKYDTIHDIAKRLVVYCSKDAHSCIEKACKLAMLRCRPIQAKEENQWGITGEQIEERIEKDLKRDLIPCFIHCTLGTIPTASCDKLTTISPVASKYGTWLHVDAAYAGGTFVEPKYRDVAEGLEAAHTININLSKFLLHSATLSIIWTREQKIYKDAFAGNPAYLKPSRATIADQRDWGLHLSRRFKALKIWFILRLCGVESLRLYVNKICEMASYFESLVDQHPNFQIFTTRNFGLFTFQYIEPNFSKEERNLHTLRLLRFFNESHKIYFTHGKLARNFIIRVSVGYERTTKETIDSAFNIMKTLTEDYKKRKHDPMLVRPHARSFSEGSAPPTDADVSVAIIKKVKKAEEQAKMTEQSEDIKTARATSPGMTEKSEENIKTARATSPGPSAPPKPAELDVAEKVTSEEQTASTEGDIHTAVSSTPKKDVVEDASQKT
ncbi:unnamed protein product [Cylicocyclus nassatus]|uniref:Tyrosine decarboxylase n=1 Tax=Cylicocyclus nassatus TaxID=53992 RepID=A0AA36M4K7_CYLNA|nr:unnamed protein product [Cylicocyclus nassatus]